AAGDLPFRGRRYLRIANTVRSGGQAIQCLIDNLPALLHLQHAHKIAVVNIAIRANRNVEIELLVARIWEDLTDIPGDSATAQNRAAGSIGDGIFFTEHRNVSGAFQPELVIGEQCVILVEALWENAGECPYLILKARRQIG